MSATVGVCGDMWLMGLGVGFAREDVTSASRNVYREAGRGAFSLAGGEGC